MNWQTCWAWSALGGIDHAILLRLISLTLAILTLSLAFAFFRVPGLTNLVAAACLLAVVPMQGPRSNAGTQDISISFILDLTMPLAVLS